jgi:flagellar basal-body rod protein FlgC
MPSIQKTSPINIAITGLAAESRRMKVISSNIANASTTGGPGGAPYRRQVVQLSTDPSGGVSVRGVTADTVTPLRKVYEPANPDAAEDGYVDMPNVELPVEMMYLTESSRSYQANAAVMKRYLEMVELTTELLK